MTPPVPTRDTPAGRAYNDLRNLARRDGRDPAEYFTQYALEGFLSRLSTSGHASDFVLKGGVLMAAFAVRRPTRDIDLSATRADSSVAEVVQRLRSIVERDSRDGLVFDTTSVSGESIRESANVAGVRVRMTARLATAQVALHVDVSFGDPIWPGPTEADLPLLLGGSLRLAGYPDHMVLAEKIVTAIDRGEQNTRWRDFVDVVAIAGTRRISNADLRAAIETVAAYRQVEVEPLGPLLEAMPQLAQHKWFIWRRKQRLESTTPERFGDLLATYLAFVDPALDDDSRSLAWDFVTQAWSR